MNRNLDIAALRSLVTIADAKGVTRAAERLHLTQSAVSMQIKRLEEAFNFQILHREGRGVALTAPGEQLVSYARRLVELNDTTWHRLTTDVVQGELTMGVPHDIVYPHIPIILRRVTTTHPLVKVTLVSELSVVLKEALSRGALDLILTTEEDCDANGETLMQAPARWVGRRHGTAHLRRPLPLAIPRKCAQKPQIMATLDAAGISWDMVVGDSDSEVTVNAMVAADLAVTLRVGFAVQADQVQITSSALPLIPPCRINLYVANAGNPLVSKFADIVRETYAMDPVVLAAQ